MKYKVQLNNKVYEVEVTQEKASIVAEYTSNAPVTVSTTRTEVIAPPPQSPLVTPVEQAPTPVQVGTPETASASAVKAPLPGTITAVKVSQGQVVSKGTVLVVMEAMKMENEIVAPKDGRIGQIYVKKDDSVVTGAPLVEIQ